MSDLDLTSEELRMILWACAALKVPDPLPEYMQDFIALRLEERAPETSTKVRRLSPEEMQLLGCLIRSSQGLP